MKNNIRVFKITSNSEMKFSNIERLSDLKLEIIYNIDSFDIIKLLNTKLSVFLIIDINTKTATFSDVNQYSDIKIEPISEFLNIIPYIDYKSNLPFNNLIELHNNKILKIIDKLSKSDVNDNRYTQKSTQVTYDYYLCVDANGYAITVEPTDIYRFINNPTYLNNIDKV